MSDQGRDSSEAARLDPPTAWIEGTGRKPRGALIAPEGARVVRFSPCCAREGCRKRATPHSLRCLGRRVYLGALVIDAMVAQALGLAQGQRVTGVSVQTARPWQGWWRGPFVSMEACVPGTEAEKVRTVGIACAWRIAEEAAWVTVRPVDRVLTCR